MRFCQAFMTELYRHIGPDVDVPAGDIGVAGREIGYLYGQYKRIKNVWENGVLTGKGLSYGGSYFRPEATGYGATYYLVEVLKHFNDSIEGKTVAVSGFGNVAWGVCEKVAQLGGKVVTISGPDGYCYDPDGITTPEKIGYLLEMRASGRDRAQDYADKFGVKFVPGAKVWGEKVDICMPCAYQNEIGMKEAQEIVNNGVEYYIEVANMPTTNEALEYLQKNVKVVAYAVRESLRWIPFDSLAPACGPDFAAALRCVTRVNVYLSGACPDKYKFNSTYGAGCICLGGENRGCLPQRGFCRAPQVRRPDLPGHVPGKSI